MESIEETSYYKQNLPQLIQRLKNSIDKVSIIIDQDIDAGISDDKLFAVLKAKRQASEDVIWTLKRIDELERELSGKVEESEEETGVPINHAKHRAQLKKANQ